MVTWERFTLRQLISVLALLLTGIIVLNMLFASSKAQQQSLLEYDLNKHHQYTEKMAARLDRLLVDVPRVEATSASLQPQLEAVLAPRLLDDADRLYLVNDSGQLLYASQAVETAQLKALIKQLGAQNGRVLQTHTALPELISAAPVPNSDWQLIVEHSVDTAALSSAGFKDSLLYSLPVTALVIALIALAAGWLGKPLRALGNYAKRLDQPGVGHAIQDTPVTYREASEIKQGLLRAHAALHPAEQPTAEGEVDALTGLSTVQVLAPLLTNIAMSGISFAAIILELDDYERVSNDLGEAISDNGLKEFTQLLLHSSRDLDVSVRLGGHTFLLLLPNCPAVIAQRIAERLRGKVEEHDFIGIGAQTLSAGVAVYQQGGDPTVVLKLAQSMLEQAKENGCNQVCVAPA